MINKKCILPTIHCNNRRISSGTCAIKDNCTKFRTASELLHLSASPFDRATMVVREMENEIQNLQSNALDWDGGEYVDVCKKDFDKLIALVSL